MLGGAGLLGTYLIGFLLRTRLYGILVAMPLAMAALAVALIGVGASPIATAVVLAAWGLISTAAPVGWWTWMSRVLPDDAEAGGGLMVAVIQLAITVGASIGGLLVDTSGYPAAFGASAAILCGSAVLAYVSARRADVETSDRLEPDASTGLQRECSRYAI